MKYITTFIIACMVSGYYFTVSFTFLPVAINSKIILAVVGIILFIVDRLNKRTLEISKGILFSALIAILFSISCLFSVDYNSTSDYSYATYISSFMIWLMGAYAVYSVIFKRHGSFNIPILTSYLAGVSAFQCIIAMLIDKNEGVKRIADAIFYTNNDFYEGINRIYGIGAALDPAGVRFAVVLILISFVLSVDDKIKNSTKAVWFFMISFIIISVIGNIISRTTTTGILLSFVVFIGYSKIYQFIIKRNNIKIYTIFFLIIAIVVPILQYLYNTDTYYYNQLRFAFEGFFNWVENGKWETSSTEKLNAVMWVWPQDTKSWIIGTGLFDGWVYSTDIGYCRFILYCGLVGFSLFILMFLYTTIYLSMKIPNYKYLFWLLFILAFIIWIKVSTDLFFIFALFLWMEESYKPKIMKE